MTCDGLYWAAAPAFSHPPSLPFFQTCPLPPLLACACDTLLSTPAGLLRYLGRAGLRCPLLTVGPAFLPLAALAGRRDSLAFLAFLAFRAFLASLAAQATPLAGWRVDGLLGPLTHWAESSAAGPDVGCPWLLHGSSMAAQWLFMAAVGCSAARCSVLHAAVGSPCSQLAARRRAACGASVCACR